MLADGGATSSRERRVLLWAELTDGTSLLIRRAEDTLSMLLGAMLVRTFETKRLRRTKRKTIVNRASVPSGTNSQITAGVQWFQVIAMEMWVDAGWITSEPPGPVQGPVWAKDVQLAAASPVVLAPAEPEPAGVPS